MIGGNCFRGKMKQILYFLIGFCTPFIWFSLAYSADVCSDMTDAQFNITVLSTTTREVSMVGVFVGTDASDQAMVAASDACCGIGQRTSLSYYATYTKEANGNYYNVWCYIDDCNHVYYAFYTTGSGDLSNDCAGPPPVDSDGDGIGDDFDLKPDSSDSYKAAIVSVCYDENNKVVAGIIQDGEGNQYQFGTMPTDFEGYTIDSITGDLVTYQTPEDLAASLEKLDIDDLNITQKNSPVEIQDDGTIIPGSTDPFKDYRNAEDDQTQAKQPETQQAPSEQPDSNDVDSGRLDKIIKNTASTNTNLENIQKYLGITNDYLAKINKKELETNVSVSGGGSVVSSTGPSADEIGQAVEDNLIDSGQTIDTTITDNIPALDETDTLTAIKTKYSDRYDLFITTLKGSDLFSLPFDIFSGPSGSGASTQTVNIGKWGSSSEQTATIDYSDYDNIWDILRSVLLLVTSFACFKILVLKKA
nr:hypothetical protein [uncultured Desulfobacter sp.]